MVTYVHVPWFMCMYVDDIARSSSPLRSLRVRHTGIGCLHTRARKEIFQSNIAIAHFFAWKNFLPRSPGSSGTTRSSARKRPFSCKSSRRASNGLNLPFSFVMPTTRLINLMPCDSRRSLYSRWGSLVIKHTGVVRGSTRGCLIGLRIYESKKEYSGVARTFYGALACAPGASF
jgi:hypothetical protein